MIKVAHIGLSSKLMGLLEAPDLLHKELQREEILERLDKVDVVVIGSEVADPVQLLQACSKRSKTVAVFVICPENQYPDLCRKIQLTPFITPNYNCFNEADTSDFVKLLIEHGERTRQRRRYLRLKESSKNRLPVVNLPFRPPQQYLDEFMEQAPIGMFLLSEKFEMLAINKRAKDIFDLNDQEALTTNWKEIFTPGQQRLLNPLFEDLSSGKQQLRFGTHCLEFSVSMVKEEEILYFLVIVEDVSERELARSRLHEKMEELQRINGELEQVAYILSHDLKNPLVPLKTYTDLALLTSSTEDKDSYLHKISQSVELVRQQIEGLEALIDVERRTKDQTEELDLDDIYNEMITAFESQLKEQKGEIIKELQVKRVRYIRPYMVSIFNNFISNAIKYSKEDEPLRLVIRSDKEGENIKLQFEDNGIGIDLEKHKNRLFQPYQRFTGQATGRGVGLSLIKKMVERNGGTINIDSEVGKGTTFTCHLKEYPPQPTS